MVILLWAISPAGYRRRPCRRTGSPPAPRCPGASAGRSSAGLRRGLARRFPLGPVLARLALVHGQHPVRIGRRGEVGRADAVGRVEAELQGVAVHRVDADLRLLEVERVLLRVRPGVGLDRPFLGTGVGEHRDPVADDHEGGRFEPDVRGDHLLAPRVRLDQRPGALQLGRARLGRVGRTGTGFRLRGRGRSADPVAVPGADSAPAARPMTRTSPTRAVFSFTRAMGRRPPSRSDRTPGESGSGVSGPSASRSAARTVESMNPAGTAAVAPSPRTRRDSPPAGSTSPRRVSRAGAGRGPVPAGP